MILSTRHITLFLAASVATVVSSHGLIYFLIFKL